MWGSLYSFPILFCQEAKDPLIDLVSIIFEIDYYDFTEKHYVG